ncbi:polysaccharide deacetylase family protein [Bacteroidota bacterium]
MKRANSILKIGSGKLLLLCFFGFLIFPSCGRTQKSKTDEAEKQASEPANWAERLGYPAGKRVLMFHADDFGMCKEANDATIKLFENNEIHAAAAMPPCPGFEEAIEWAKKHPNVDVGLHLALTSEMRIPKWGAVTDPNEVLGLLNSEGHFYSNVEGVVENATAEEVEKELRAQIEKSLAMGYTPGHLDGHMGTIWGTTGFTKAFLKLAQEYDIPARVMTNPEERELPEEQIELIKNYPGPKLDRFVPIPNPGTYEGMRDGFMEMIKNLEPGISEIYFHPQVKSERSEQITRVWQTRVWEYELFGDPVVKKFLEQEDVLYTDWIEMNKRFKEMKK